jgi:hypothetical protein
MNTCNCAICQRSQQFQEALKLVPETDKQFWKDLFSLLYDVEMDRDYYRAIVDGSWPNADEVIHQRRTKKEASK